MAAKIKIYDSFYSSCLCTCENVFDFAITQTINDDYRITFKVPITTNDFDKSHYINTSNTIIYNGQKFRIVKVNKESSESGSRIITVTALYYYYTDLKIIKPKFGDYYGISISRLINLIFANTGFDMQCMIDDKTDFQMTDVKTVRELVDMVIENLGYGELKFVGNEFYLVETVGYLKSIPLKLDSNCQSIIREDDSSNLVTRLYPYGAENLGIESLQSSGCITSDNVGVYGLYDGTVTYGGIKDANNLIKRAWWDFSNENINRIDIPSTNITVKYVNLEYDDMELKSLGIGDEVNVYDEAMGTDGEVFRIRQITKYPDEPEKDEIILGKLKANLFQYLKKLNKGYKGIASIEAGNNSNVNNQIYNTITEVTREEVLSADVIEASAVFSEDLFVERLATNIKPYKCIPNLIVENGTLKWKGESHTYSSSVSGTIRGSIELEGISQKFKECHLKPVADLSNIGLDSVQPLIVNGRQVYYTSVLGGQNPYQYFTFVEPKTKYPSMTAENAEMFKVYIRAYEGEYTKAEFEFTKIEGNTFKVRFILGTGDEAGNGKIIIEKDGDYGYLKMKSRTDGRERGYRVGDDGTEYCTDGKNWMKMRNYYVVDTMPTSSVAEGDIYYVKAE